jgi:hypothetical protein
MKDAKGHGSTAHQAGIESATDHEQRFHLGFKYTNPEKGWQNTGNAVVHHANIEGAAQRLMAERKIPSMFVTQRYHANGQVDDINREFRNPEYKAPAASVSKSKRK